MLLDRYQLDEIDRHYGSCFLDAGDRGLFYCERAEGNNGLGVLWANRGNITGSPATINFRDLEHLDIPLGYYNTPEGSMMFSRIPSQHHKRSICSNNSTFLRTTYERGILTGDSLGLHTRNLVASYMDNKFPVRLKTEDYNKSVLSFIHSTKGFTPIALNRFYSIIPDADPKMKGKRPVLINFSGAVGYFEGASLIISKKSVHMVDSIIEAFKDYTDYEPEIRVA